MQNDTTLKINSNSIYQSLVPAILVSLTGWFIYILHLADMGGSDWGWYLNKYEVIRMSFLKYHQFPFWNPWHCGGTPLYAHPEVGVFSIETILSLIFGTLVGLNLSVVVYLIIGSVGFWFFLTDYSKNKVTLFWGTILFALQGTFSMHIAAGHTVMMVMVWFPWILFLIKRMKDSITASVILGMIFAVIVNTAIHYIAVLIFVFSFFVLLCELSKRVKSRDIPYLQNFAAMVLVFLTLSCYRLILAYSYFSEYPRIMNLRASFPVTTFLTSLVYPFQHSNSFPPGPYEYWRWHEIGSYIGIIALVMFIISFWREIKWWQILAIITFPLVFNSSCEFLPGYWIRALPVFKSMFCITRWRFFTIFFIIIGACRGMDYLIQRLDGFKNKKIRYIPYLLIAISTTGLVVHAFYNWSHYEWESLENSLQKVPVSSPSIVNSCASGINYFSAVKKGVGLIFAEESLLGYSQNYKTPRLFYESEYYHGELFFLGKLVEKYDYEYWSPNKLIINPDKAGLFLINQNPGSYWLVSDMQLFPKYRSFELGKPFALVINNPKKMVISAVPPLHGKALNLTLFSLLFSVIYLFVLYKIRRKKSRIKVENTPLNNGKSEVI